MRSTVRNRWRVVHQWLGLSLGLLITLVALSGAALTVARPLDQSLHPELFRSTSARLEPGALDRALQSIKGELGPSASITFRPPREPGDTLWALVKGPWNGTVYFDPADGRELGRRGEHEGFFNWLFEWHSELLLGEAGKAVLAVTALSYLVSWITGLVLWWPKNWAKAWTVKADRGAHRFLLDLHKVGGAVLGVLILVSVASGAYMAWRPLGAALTSLSSGEPVAPPKVPAQTVSRNYESMDALMARAKAVWPEGYVGYMQVPAKPDRPVRVRIRLPGEPHPNGLSSVWLNGSTGEVLAAHRWHELDLGARATAIIYPLHTGALGGTAHITMNALLGLSLSALSISGLWLWAGKKRPGRRSMHTAGRIKPAWPP